MPDIHIVSRIELQDHKAASATVLAIAVGCIAYPGGAKGEIPYLKPTFLDELPADVPAYGRSHKAFPHDNTAHQWFSESQFESYRELGRWHFDNLAADSLEDLFASARTAVARWSGSKRAQNAGRKAAILSDRVDLHLASASHMRRTSKVRSGSGWGPAEPV
jgi:hypothetical protein